MSSSIYSEPFIPPLKAGYFVAIHPLKQFGLYRVPEGSVIEYLPPKVVNLATPWTKAVPPASRTSQTPLVVSEVEDFNMENNKLAVYRLGVLDNVYIKIKQPTAVSRFTTRGDVLAFDKGQLYASIRRGLYNILPELYIFADKTEPTFEVYNYEYRETYFARIFATGYSFTLEKVEMDIGEIRTPVLHLTVNASGG